MRNFMRRIQARWAVQSHRRPLGAVDDSGLEAVLGEYGLVRKMRRSELKCKYCGEPVARSRIYALFRESGAIKVVCSNPQCIQGLLERWSK